MPGLVAPVAGALDADAISHLTTTRDEPDWLGSLRVAAWEQYAASAWPTGSEEEWRRTPLSDLPREAPLVTDAAAEVSVLDPEFAARGVVFADLGTASREHPDLVRRALEADPPGPATHTPFWHLARAAWTAGTFLHVPAGVTVDLVLRARTAATRGGAAFFPRTVVIAEAGAAVTLLDEFASPDGEPSWFGGTVDIRVGQGARVRYANLQRLGDQAWNIGAQRVEVGADSEVTTLNAQVGSRVTKLGMNVLMSGRGGTSRLLGILAAGDDQRIDINSLQDLSASNTTSDLLYLSALYDAAHAVFYGSTRVRSEAKQTSSFQECRNLLLSSKAGAEPIPVLEIETNDILRCGHGATAGAIDPVQMFYAQSRGLSHDESERMIVRGFFERVVAQIGSEAIRAHVLAALEDRIGSADVVAA